VVAGESAGQPVPLIRHRSSAFSYACHACRRCCYHKRIQLNPYEMARLSRHLGCTTTEFIDRFTAHEGTALASQSDGACVFLGEGGCTVHTARPLACRLYPLGRIALDDGREVFVEHAPHPETEGVYGADGTVADFLTSQGVEPYVDAAERYYSILRMLQEGADAAGDATPYTASVPEDVLDAADFIDADFAVTRASGTPSTHLSAEELVERHLALLEQRARDLPAV
jgi:Fe-S-cluster containining protein